MTHSKLLSVLGTLIMIWSFPYMAANAQTFWRDPFERPKLAAGSTMMKSEITGADWSPTLRAIMYDKKRSLVNIDGKILALGESLQGYRLTKVEERSVVITKNNVDLKLMLDKENF